MASRALQITAALCKQPFTRRAWIHTDRGECSRPLRVSAPWQPGEHLKRENRGTAGRRPPQACCFRNDSMAASRASAVLQKCLQGKHQDAASLDPLDHEMTLRSCANAGKDPKALHVFGWSLLRRSGPLSEAIDLTHRHGKRWGPGFVANVFVFSMYCLGFRFDEYTRLAGVAGMARTEAVCEVFWPSGLRPSVRHSVCKSVGPAPPVYPVAFRAWAPRLYGVTFLMARCS